MAGSTLNDPFLRIPFAGYGVTWHMNAILGIELQGASTWLGTASDDCYDPRWRPIVCDSLRRPDHVPSFEPYLTHQIHAGLAFAPLHGTLAVGYRTFELRWYFRAGFGAAMLMPDDNVEFTEDGSGLAPTWLPTTDMAQGIRVTLSRHLALRAELRHCLYVDPVNSTTLELRNLLIGQAGMSVLLGHRENPL